MACLSYNDSSGQRRRVDLTQRVNIGRHPAQDIQLLDRVVSKEHAILEYRDGAYFLVDLGSRNGTFVNGRQISASQPHRLENGDEITIGSTGFRFEGTNSESALVDRVKTEALDSRIHTRISSTYDVGFLPESHISNVETLRADYEKLRIAN